MNATVEVETVAVSAKVESVTVWAYTNAPVLEVKAAQVSTSTLRVISQGNHSISAVAPDYFLTNGGLAVA